MNPATKSVISSHASVPILAVKDVSKARRFYEEVVGATVEKGDQPEVLRCNTGGKEFLIYKSDLAGTNKANALVWQLGKDFDRAMDDLQKKGAKFEHYTDMPGVKLEGDVHVAGDMKMAWFKDLDGNILHIMNQ